MTFLKYIVFTVLGLAILAIGSVYVLSIQREISIKTINIEVAENLVIPVEEMDSQRKYYGGHGAGWGGGDIKNSLKFKYANMIFFNETPYIPVVLKMYQKQFYVVYYDRETYLRETTFRFYKSTQAGDFKEIEPTEFPKHLAIQNRWFKGYDSDPNDLVGLVPKKIKGTMTSKIWYMIEGKENKFTHNTPVHLDFIKQYKEKYITNRQED